MSHFDTILMISCHNAKDIISCLNRQYSTTDTDPFVSFVTLWFEGNNHSIINDHYNVGRLTRIFCTKIHIRISWKLELLTDPKN